jgi:hypothetical protein
MKWGDAEARYSDIKQNGKRFGLRQSQIRNVIPDTLS